jgi:ribosomal protein L30E
MKKVILLAPHDDEITNNGNNIYSRWVKESLYQSCELHYVSMKSHTVFVDGNVVSSNTLNFVDKSPLNSLIDSFVKFKSYHTSRLVPKGYVEYCGTVVEQFDVAIYSYVFTYFELSKTKRLKAKREYILTHNYDIEIFEKWNQSLALKLIGKFEIFKYVKSIKQIPKSVNISSINNHDADLYKRLMPNNLHSIIPPTIHQPKDSWNSKRQSDTIKLCFLGSLTTPFNIEALVYFSEKIEPQLRELVAFEFYVFGSKPTNKVIELAKRKNWILRENLDNDTLDKELMSMTVGLLPFHKTAGTKLKVFHYLSVGLPVLGTGIFIKETIPFKDVFFSSDIVLDWAERIKDIQKNRNQYAELAIKHTDILLEKYKSDIINQIIH